jgi:hypothetical protein
MLCQVIHFGVIVFAWGSFAVSLYRCLDAEICDQLLRDVTSPAFVKSRQPGLRDLRRESRAAGLESELSLV